MGIFKILSDGWRFRCNRYRAPGDRHCAHEINLPRYDLYLGHNLSARRDTQAARDALAMTYHRYPQLKRSEILTDGLWSDASALGDLQIPARAHRVYLSFFEEPRLRLCRLG